MAVALRTLLGLACWSALAAAQSLTTVVTPPGLADTGGLALGEHAAAFLGRRTSDPTTTEVYVYFFGPHLRLQVTTNQREEHSLVSGGDRFLWVEGRGAGEKAWEFFIPRGRLRQVAVPGSIATLQWLAADHELALAFDAGTGCLWRVNLTRDQWRCLAAGYRPGAEALADQTAVWTDGQHLFHHVAGGSVTTFYRTQATTIRELALAPPFVAWAEDKGSLATREILAAQLGTTQVLQITRNAYPDREPVLVGSRLVWRAPLSGTGPEVLHWVDLTQPTSLHIIPSQARRLFPAWDGLFFNAGPNGTDLLYHDFLLNVTRTVAVNLAPGRSDAAARGRMALYRKTSRELRLYLPALDVRPTDPRVRDAQRVILYLAAGPTWGGSTYVAAASFAGYAPGIRIGLVTVPLNLDALVFLSLLLANQVIFENTVATLFANGTQLAYFNPPAEIRAALLGVDMYWAYLLAPTRFASNPVRMRYRP